MELEWLIIAAFCLFVLRSMLGERRRRHYGQRVVRSRKGSWVRDFVARRSVGKQVKGKAKVVDGDGVHVAGLSIRMAGIDAPEGRQVAVTADGEQVDHGALAKKALIKKLGGSEVVVRIEGVDEFKRYLGVVILGKEDINAWMVRNGYAVAVFGDRYLRHQKNAQRESRGMWGYREAYHPQGWKHGRRESLVSRSPLQWGRAAQLIIGAVVLVVVLRVVSGA